MKIESWFSRTRTSFIVPGCSLSVIFTVVRFAMKSRAVVTSHFCLCKTVCVFYILRYNSKVFQKEYECNVFIIANVIENVHLRNVMA